MTEQKALETARSVFDPAFATGADMCACGKSAAGRCGHGDEQVIPIDVLKGMPSVH
jgi:hypothetical protein